MVPITSAALRPRRSIPTTTPVGGTQLGYARVSTAHQSLDQQTDALTSAGVDATRIYEDKLSRHLNTGPAIDLPRQRKASAAMSIPAPDEVGKLLREADSRFVAFIGLCAFGGLRVGEAAALQVGDVDVGHVEHLWAPLARRQ
jgi:integrase